MKYTVDEINANQVLLPGITLGYNIFDTCSQSAALVKATMFLLSDKATGELAVKCNYTDYEPRVVAIIGPQTSEMVTVIGNLLGFFLMPQISYAATSTKFSDKGLYPSFMRTVPDDQVQAVAIMHLLQRFNWNWVALVGSDDEYGRQGLQELSSLTENTTICIAYKGRIPVYTDPYPEIEIILNNINITDVGVVVVFSLAKHAKVFFEEVVRRNMTAVWIASTAWALNSRVSDLPDIHTIGTVIGLTDSTQELPLFISYARELFTKISQETQEDSEGAPGHTHPQNPCPEYDIQCKKCPKGQWSLVSSINCTEPTFEYLTWSQPEVLGLILAAAVLIACHASVGVLFLKHRGTPLVRASGGALSGLALLCLTASCLSLGLFLGQPGNMACRLQMPLNSIFPTVALGTITVISLEMFYVTEFPEKAVAHLDLIKRAEGWLVLACCCVQAGLCGWFTQTVPLLSQYLADMDIHFVKEFLACPVELLSLGIMQGFNVGMALVSFMCTFMAVKPVHQYNLARDITFSTLLYCVIWVIFIPIYTSLSDKFKSIVYMTFSLGSNIGLVAPYYFPKCHLLLKKPELNKPEYFRSFLEGAPPIPLEEEPPTQTDGQEPKAKPDDPHKD
ncbi:hypothetical protein CRUP_022070 [Coryphaenoides rupestris]|nr:hypothetical protein CRUP_022070 [Coryphaenoides rupestris]